jgi:hypothetical protein
VLAITAAAACGGCGYRPLVARVPGGGERVFVPTVENRTSHGGLAGPLTSDLRRELERAGLDVVGAGTDAPELRVAVVTVRGGPGMLGIERDRLVPVDNVWEIAAEASVSSAGGEVLAEPVLLTVDARSLAGDGVTTEQALGARARDQLIGRLAREIVRVLFEEP